MNKFIALLGGLTLVGVVACDEGKPAAEKKVEKTAMKVEKKVEAAAKDDHAHPHKEGVKHDHDHDKKEMDPAAKEAAETEAYAAKILTTDYDAEALKEIDDANAEAELKALEAAIDSK